MLTEDQTSAATPRGTRRTTVADGDVPVTAKGARTRRRILEAAARRFRRDGYAATSLRAIAADAGLRDGSLYYYFATKDDLVDAVLRTGLTAIEAATRRAVEGLGPEASAVEQLKVAIEAHVRTNLAAGDFASANLRILGQLPVEMRHRHEREQLTYAEYWEGLLAAGRASGELRCDLNPTLVRLLFLGAMNWAVEWYDATRATPSEVSAVCAEMILSGLVPRCDDEGTCDAPK